MKKLTIIVILSMALLQGCQWRNNAPNNPNNLEPSNITEKQQVTPETNNNLMGPQDITNGIGQQSPPQSNTQGNTPIGNNTQSNNANTNKNPTNSPSGNTATNNNSTTRPGTNSSTGSNNNAGSQSPGNSSANNSNTQSGSTLPTIATNYSNEYLSNLEDQILALVNQERAKIGVGSLTMSGTLRQAARYKANEMLQYNYFSHSSPYTNNPWDIAKAYGHSYTTFGENIWTMSASSLSTLKSSLDANTIVNSWMNSQGHRENILKSSFRNMGVGVVVGSNGKCYVSQMFSD